MHGFHDVYLPRSSKSALITSKFQMNDKFNHSHIPYDAIAALCNVGDTLFWLQFFTGMKYEQWNAPHQTTPPPRLSPLHLQHNNPLSIIPRFTALLNLPSSTQHLETSQVFTMTSPLLKSQLHHERISQAKHHNPTSYTSTNIFTLLHIALSEASGECLPPLTIMNFSSQYVHYSILMKAHTSIPGVLPSPPSHPPSTSSKDFVAHRQNPELPRCSGNGKTNSSIRSL